MTMSVEGMNNPNVEGQPTLQDVVSHLLRATNSLAAQQVTSQSRFDNLVQLMTSSQITPHGNNPTPQNVLRDIKPPLFHGERDCSEFETWEFQMDQYLALHPNMSQDAKMKVVGLSLRGAAAALYKDLCNLPVGQKPTTWNELATELKAVFLPVGRSKLARDELAEAKQEKLSLSTYTTKMRKLYMAIPDIAEGEKVDRYVRGLSSRYLQKEIFVHDPKTFEEAVKFATRYDSFRNSSKGSPGNHHHDKSRNNGPAPMELGAVRNDKPAKKYNPKCYNCGELGHIRRNCPKLQGKGKA